MPEHASIARRQLAIFVGRRERYEKNILGKYDKNDSFDRTSKFGFSEFSIGCNANDITNNKVILLNLKYINNF